MAITTTIEVLAAELGVSCEDAVDYLKSTGVRDLNGWDPTWGLHSGEAQTLRDHYKKEPHE
ncbi:hypothetical protein PBI_EDMUNDO_57 [Arthrobacter phage Edmundo]|nr:hypothetical protein PBI_EDMUNDO_57 [Arthrobacter phage Edmundo]